MICLDFTERISLMTVTQLSARSVKVQLTADELRFFLPDEAPPAESPQMLRLLAYMLMHAETGSSIPFSELPVTVELLTVADGGLIAYFTAQLPEHAPRSKASKTVRLAASFADYSALSACCRQLIQENNAILVSTLYQYGTHWILSLKLHRNTASHAHHILLEYGKPFRSSALNKAKLTEYGTCIYEKDAVSAVLNSKSESA